MTDVVYMPYYPNYTHLDSILQVNNNVNTFNIFVDLKNCMQTIYMEHAVLNVVNTVKITGHFHTGMFESVLDFIAFHKIYAKKRNIHINMFFFLEIGRSQYHLNISANYKVSRIIDEIYGLDKQERDIFIKNTQSNYLLINQVCNKLPYVWSVLLKKMEADFIPYYIISRNLCERNKNTMNIIYSNDHDMSQCLSLGSDVIIFKKVKKMKYVLFPLDGVKKEFGKNYDKVKDLGLDERYIPLFLSICGDEGDDVYGIKGIGPARFIGMFPQLQKLINDNVNELYENVMTKKPIFCEENDIKMNKYLNLVLESERTNQTVSKNLRLTSFEIMSMVLENPDTTEMLDRKKTTVETLRSRIYINKNVMEESLIKLGVEINDNLDKIY